MRNLIIPTSRAANQYDLIVFSTIIRVEYDNTISPLKIRFFNNNKKNKYP